ncbi:hypothetical protein Droror1_Dr00002481 [Drosera rotundifolia]
MVFHRHVRQASLKSSKQGVEDGKGASVELSLSWVYSDDFNEIMESEKQGGLPRDSRLMSEFQDTLESCGLFDLGSRGCRFTWCKRVRGGVWVRKRLDRVVASLSRIFLFPDAYANCCHGFVRSLNAKR